MKIAVIGAGSWGTALANLLAHNGHNVSLWARRSEVATSINKDHRNPRYLTDVELHSDVVATLSHRDAVLRARAAVIVTPSNLLRGVARALADAVDQDFPVIICSKGVEEGSGMLPIEVFASEMGNPDRFAVLSGPNHAEEVVRGIPSGTVIASPSRDTAEFFRDAFAAPSFRTYISRDVAGVELCAAFKNVIAIAVGLSYGLGFGDNTAAMLMTRGLAEMSRLVVKAGGQAITCMGLAGTGDLIATCTSEHSRNRRFAGDSFPDGAGQDGRRGQDARRFHAGDAHGRRGRARLQDHRDAGGALRRRAAHHRGGARGGVGGRRAQGDRARPGGPPAHD